MQQFKASMQKQFDKMCATGKLFRSSLTGQQVWDLYLKSFDADPIFRDPASSEHNCNNCNNFIRRYGNIVAIGDNLEVMTMFDFTGKEEYVPVTKALSKALKAAAVKEVFFETFNELNSLPYETCTKHSTSFKLGIDKNVKRYTKEEAEKFGVVKADEIKTFHHMSLQLSSAYVNTSGKSVEAIMGEYRDAKNVFQRAMETISLDTLLLVKDLIKQGSLLDGETHLYKIEQIIPLKEQYDTLPKKEQDLWCWITSYNLPFAKFKNELIGVLCSELSEGEELNKACESWNKRVDPANYMKATAPITKKQIEDARKFVEENGYTESFNRRFATMDDIRASEILHVNVGKDAVKAVSMFDKVKATSTRHKRSEFEGVEEVGIDKFMKDILPSCTGVEAFFTSSQQGNLVSLTTAVDQNCKPLFKWSNNYSWTFNGNLAGKSQMKEAVKSAGGKVDGVLRFSISWNEDGRSICDFDAHALEPDGRTEIAFNTYKGNLHESPSSGMLDVDMISPSHMGVENITWTDPNKMKNGTYKFWIRNYNSGHNTGFKAEIEFDGEVYHYEKLGNIKADVHVAEVTLKNGVFTIKHFLPETGGNVSKEIYGLDTNQFHRVNLVCLSPNHWGTAAIGNKHYFFMLENCKATSAIRSFHSENLLPEVAQHRKVLEVLGATSMIEPADKQLSGLGFNATVRDEVVLRLSGTHKRVIKLKF